MAVSRLPCSWGVGWTHTPLRGWMGACSVRTHCPTKHRHCLLVFCWTSRAVCAAVIVPPTQETAIILYDFCRALDIPIMVWYLITSHRVDLTPTQSSTPSRDDRYRRTSPPGGSARDGAALRYVAGDWRSGRRDVKILDAGIRWAAR